MSYMEKDSCEKWAASAAPDPTNSFLVSSSKSSPFRHLSCETTQVFASFLGPGSFIKFCAQGSMPEKKKWTLP